MRLLSISRNLTPGGAGLGNELIPAAKSHLCALATGSRLVPHAWGWNGRGYRNLFGTSILDPLPPHVALKLLPKLEIGRRQWLDHRIEDYGSLCRHLLDRHTFPALAPAGAIVHSGMWGGFCLIDPAKPWVKALLASAKGAPERLAAFQRTTSGAAFKVGVHVRRGDFSAMTGPLRGKFNFSIPMAWYQQVLSSVLPMLPAETLVCAFSDAILPGDELLPRGWPAERLWQAPTPGHDTADLLSLAACDLLVCSVSSYSTMAAWLGGKPYLWLKDQMQEASGRLSIWGDEASEGNWLQAMSFAPPEISLRSPCIPTSLHADFDRRHLAAILADGHATDRRLDPIRYGCTS